MPTALVADDPGLVSSQHIVSSRTQALSYRPLLHIARKVGTHLSHSATDSPSASSPRHSLRSRPAPVPMDEDPIPTSSLHDDPPTRVTQQQAEAPVELPLPPALEAGIDTTTLHVFGPPVECLAALRSYLENIGPVVSYIPGPDGSNWYTVQYANALAASYALRRHGEIISGRWMLAFKVAGPGSTQGLTIVNGVSSASEVAPLGIGTPLQVHHENILRPKPKAMITKDEYAWEEVEQPSGILGRAAEFIVSDTSLPC